MTGLEHVGVGIGSVPINTYTSTINVQSGRSVRNKLIDLTNETEKSTGIFVPVFGREAALTAESMLIFW